jgi:hypothetical protein
LACIGSGPDRERRGAAVINLCGVAIMVGSIFLIFNRPL